jgi:hypothetical protein
MELRHSPIFVSYSHKDKKWLEKLHPHLGSLAREKGLHSFSFDDTAIKSGSYWTDEITHALNSAKVAILLISKHYLDS